MLVRLCLLLCVAAALAKRHRPAVVELAPREERVPSDAIGDVALRDRLETVHRARLARLLRLRRRQQQQQQQPGSPQSRPRPAAVAHGGPDAAMAAPEGAGGGRRDYDDNDDYSSGDDGDTLYADEEEEGQSGGMHGGVGGGRGGKQGDGRSGGRVGSSHRDPYTDVGDDDDNYNDNKGRGPKGLSGGEIEGANGKDGPASSRDGQRQWGRMDCIVDPVNHCIEWCRLKPTDTRLRQNRDNEPCRYWKGDSKNRWMQSGVCHNGRCG
nr:uncharacterized protein LOC126528948 [Dermacentor andersoni]